MPQHPHKSLTYRPALDGLRGIAVAAVVIYHVWPGALPGGWLGVDLFFVLSGFLITTLLTTEWHRWGSISLRGFWMARARRLLPSLLAMLLVVTIVSNIWTLPSRRLAVGLDALFSLFYFANWRMYFSNEAYFATDVGLPSPVRHTWSLAIEEQYYLLYPLLLLGLLLAVRNVAPRWRRHLLGTTLLVMAAVSAWRMHALYIPDADPSRVYYGTDTRAFELLIGSAAGIWLSGKEFSGRRRKKFDTVAGWLSWPALIALLVAFASLNEGRNILFPWGLLTLSVIAMVPIIAAMAKRHSRASIALSWEPLRGLGLISYALYLWHWPVIVFLGPEHLPLDGFWLGAAQVAISLALAYTSWRFLESPIRRGGLKALLPSVPVAGRVVGGVAIPWVLLATVVLAQGGVAQAAQQGAAGSGGGDLTYTAPDYKPLPSNQTVALIGNSIPDSVQRAFLPSQYPDLTVQPDVNFGCDPFEGAVVLNGKKLPTLANYVGFQTQWKQQIAVIKPQLAAFFIPQTMLMDHEVDGKTAKFGTPAYTKFIRSSLDGVRKGALSNGAHQFAVVTLACHNLPFANRNPQFALMNDDRRVTRINSEVNAWAKERRAPVIDQYGFLCTGGFHSTLGGTPLHEDGLHFSAASGATFWTWLAPQIQKILRRQ